MKTYISIVLTIIFVVIATIANNFDIDWLLKISVVLCLISLYVSAILVLWGNK